MDAMSRATMGDLLQAAAREGGGGARRRRPTEAERIARHIAPVVFALAAWTLLVALALFWLPWGSEVPHPEEVFEEVRLTHWWVAWALRGAGLTGVLGLLVAGPFSAPGRDPRAFQAALLALLALAAAWWSQARVQAPWVLATRKQGFAILLRGEGRGQRVFLASEDPEDLLSTRFGVLDGILLDEANGWSWVVRRRREARDGGWQIHLDREGAVLGVYDQNLCFLLHSRNPLLYLPAEMADVRSFDEARDKVLRALPPFLLIGPHDEPYGPDIANLMGTVRSSAPDAPGWPHPDHVADALEHPVPEVRAAAAAIRRVLDERRHLLEDAGP